LGPFRRKSGWQTEIDRRMADPNPEYADPAEIEAIFRRYSQA